MSVSENSVSCTSMSYELFYMYMSIIFLKGTVNKFLEKRGLRNNYEDYLSYLEGRGVI